MFDISTSITPIPTIFIINKRLYTYIYIYVVRLTKNSLMILLDPIYPQTQLHQKATMLLPIFLFSLLVSTNALINIPKILLDPLDLIPELPDLGAIAAGPEDAQLTTVSTIDFFIRHKFVL